MWIFFLETMNLYGLIIFVNSSASVTCRSCLHSLYLKNFIQNINVILTSA